MKKITVTDHAILRYIERYIGLNLKQIRDEIEKAVHAGVQVGATTVKKDRLIYVIQNHEKVAAVTTVLIDGRGNEVTRGNHRQREKAAR